MKNLIIRILAIILCLLPYIAKSETTDLIRNGKLQSSSMMKFKDVSQKSDYVDLSDFIEITKQIKYGDFKISLRLTLPEEKESSFVLSVGADKYFFDIKSGFLVSRGNEGGVCFRDKPLRYNFQNDINGDEPIYLQVENRNGNLLVDINSENVYSNAFDRDTIGVVRLDTFKGVARLYDLSVTGVLAELPQRTVVFKKGEYGYAFFRIPALLNVGGDKLLAFAEGRKNGLGDNGDIDLVMKRSVDGGRSWSDFMVVHEKGGDDTIMVSNPCPVYDARNKVVLLVFQICKHWGRGEFELMVMKSRDDGKTWTKPVDIRNSVAATNWVSMQPGPGHGIQIVNGGYKNRIIVPCWFGERNDGKTKFHTTVLYSDDLGVTWHVSHSISRDTDESLVAEISKGNLYWSLRPFFKAETAQEFRKYSISRNGGANWTKPVYDENLKSVMCQAGLLSSPNIDNTVYMSYPASGSYTATKPHRAGLTVFKSSDDGKSWSKEQMVYAGRSAYSDLVRYSDGKALGVLFECGQHSAYETISFSKIDQF